MVGVSWKSFFYFNHENGLYMVLFVIGGGGLYKEITVTESSLLQKPIEYFGGE